MDFDTGERAVFCQDCNGYLYAEAGDDIRLAVCPYNCRYEDGHLVMDVREGEQRYGRS